MRAIIVLIAACAACLCQNNTGRISGSVADASGALIPNASISITNESTGIVTRATTDKDGFFVAPNLQVGSYKVMAEAPGFRPAEKTGYDLTDAGRITADFKLEVGSTNQSVQVTEVLGETVNTVSGELNRTIDSEQVQDLALNGRNYLQLVSLTPGVALLDEDQMATTTSLSVTTWAANGGRPGTSHLTVDGGMNLDSGSNGSQVNNVGVSFVREVRISSSAMSAENGRNSGAAVNAVTKSGGSRYEGELLYTFRNDALDARNFYAPVKPKLRFNDFGYSIGGPIAVGPLKPGKLFFFAGQEWKRIRQFTAPTRRTLPTLAEIGGDFSDRATTNIRFPGTTTPIPNKDLRSLITPDGLAIMKVYGAAIQRAALYTNTPTQNNTTFQVLNPFNWRQDYIKINYRMTDRQELYFRWIHDNYDLVDPFGTFNSSQLPNTPTQRNRPGYGPQLGHTWTLTATLVNEFKVNTSWNGQRTPLVGDAWQRATYGFQFPLLNGTKSGLGPYPNGIPDVTINSFASFNGPSRVFLISPTTDIGIIDNITKVAGDHTWKSGVQIVRNRKDQNGRSVYNGSVNFNTNPNANTTGYALADVLTGNFSTYTEAAGDPVGFFRFSQIEGYVQDSWRVLRNFSIEIGLRYSHFTPTYTTGNNIVNFDPSLYNAAQAIQVTSQGLVVPNSGNLYNGLIRAGNGVPTDQAGRVLNADSPLVRLVPAGAPRGFYPAYNLWMPRFSFAWAPRGSKMAIRGGFGSFHDRVQGNLIFSQTNIAPFSTSAAYESGNLGNPGAGVVSAQAVMGGINAIDPNLKVPAVYNYNFGLQREMWKGIFLDLSYTGNVGHHLLRQPDINFPSFDLLATNYQIPSAQRPVTNAIRPYRGFSTIRMFLSDANSNYNSLQTYVTRRKGNVVTTVSYTWSHALADASSDTDNLDSGIGYQNRHYGYGPTSFDRRHVFVLTYTYRIPWLRTAHGILGGALGRWEVSGITRGQSGPHLTPVGSATGVTRRADYLGGDVSLDTSVRTPDHWFNTAAFKSASSTALGNAGIGTIVAPGLYLWDLSLRKEFAFSLERKMRLRFQADAFNLMNHANLRGLNVTTSDAAYGTMSGAGPARNIQFGARLAF